MRLSSHYTTWSLTTKALFSLLASELPYPDTEPESLVNPGIPAGTLSQALHDAGYFTALLSSQDFTWEREIAFLRNRGFEVMHDMRTLPGREKAWSSPWGIDDRVAVQALLAAMDAHLDRPFFGFLQLVSGHHPYIALEEHEKALADLPRAERYLKAITVADDRLRDLVDGLRARGRWDRTLLVVVSDHGEAHAVGQGRNLFQSVVRVPAIVVGPQTTGATVSRVTSHVDLAPTVLGLVGVPVPCTMKGRDLTRPARDRIALFGGRPPDFQFGAVDGSYKYVLEGDGTERLYDLSLDPRGTVNRAAEHAGILRGLSDRVRAWQDGSRWLIPNYEAYLAASRCSRAEGAP